MKLKLLFIIVVFSIFQSCEVPFEDNARILVKGELFDENNQPISGAQIGVFVRRGNDFAFNSGPSFPSDNLIGNATSEDDGSFSVITLLGRDDDFIVEVYVSNEYTKYTYRTDTEEFTPTDNLINLGIVPIKRRAQFNFNITRTSPPNTQLQYTLEYKNTFCSETFFNEQLNEEESFCFTTENIGRTLDNDRPDASGTVATFVSSEVIFTYSIDGQPEQSQTLIIDQPNYEFNFSY